MPNARPTVARIAPACAPIESAPDAALAPDVVEDALGDAAEVPAVPDAAVPAVVPDVVVFVELVAASVALAAVWNASNDFAAVGLTANT